MLKHNFTGMTGLHILTHYNKSKIKVLNIMLTLI